MGGADVMLAIMKGLFPDGADRDEYKNIFYESLLPCVELAEKLGNDLTIEAANRFECPYLWTADETLEFVNRFDSDRVTVHLDTFHMNIEDKDMEAAIRMCKGKLGHFHVSDNDRRSPGHSHVDFKMCIDTLYDIGYTGKPSASNSGPTPTGNGRAPGPRAHPAVPARLNVASRRFSYYNERGEYTSPRLRLKGKKPSVGAEARRAIRLKRPKEGPAMPWYKRIFTGRYGVKRLSVVLFVIAGLLLVWSFIMPVYWRRSMPLLGPSFSLRWGCGAVCRGILGAAFRKSRRSTCCGRVSGCLGSGQRRASRAGGRTAVSSSSGARAAGRNCACHGARDSYASPASAARASSSGKSEIRA